MSLCDAFRPCSRDSSGDKGQFCSVISQIKRKKNMSWNRTPPPLFLPFLGYMSSSSIWLLHNFSPTTYRPPLPSRLLTRYSKPSKFTTDKIHYLVPKFTSFCSNSGVGSYPGRATRVFATQLDSGLLAQRRLLRRGCTQ